MFELDWHTIARWMFPLLPVIWVSSGFALGYYVCNRKHLEYKEQVDEISAVLDECQTNELEAKDETISVLRGVVYAISDENGNTNSLMG